MKYTHAEVAEALTETQALDIVTRNMEADDSDEYAMAFVGRVVVRNVRKYVEQKRRDEEERAEQESDMRNIDDRGWWEHQDAAGWKG